MTQDRLYNNNTKLFCYFIEAKRQDNIGVSPLKDGGQLYSDSKTIAKILVRLFKLVFLRDTDNQLPDMKNPSTQQIHHISISTAGVCMLL